MAGAARSLLMVLALAWQHAECNYSESVDDTSPSLPGDEHPPVAVHIGAMPLMQMGCTDDPGATRMERGALPLFSYTIVSSRSRMNETAMVGGSHAAVVQLFDHDTRQVDHSCIVNVWGTGALSSNDILVAREDILLLLSPHIDRSSCAPPSSSVSSKIQQWRQRMQALPLHSIPLPLPMLPQDDGDLDARETEQASLAATCAGEYFEHGITALAHSDIHDRYTIDSAFDAAYICNRIAALNIGTIKFVGDAFMQHMHRIAGIRMKDAREALSDYDDEALQACSPVLNFSFVRGFAR